MFIVESFQEYLISHIHIPDMNKVDFNRFDLFLDHLKTIDHFNLKFLIRYRHTASFKSSGFLKF